MNRYKPALGGLLLLLAANTVGADEAAKPRAKDIVLAPLYQQSQQSAPPPGGAQPYGTTAPAPVAAYDGMAVAILVERADGVLIPQPVSQRLATGQFFRVKVLVPRDGKLRFYNTPSSQSGLPPQSRRDVLVWEADARAGMELISERMQLTGQRGEDLLHVVLEPRDPRPSTGGNWFANLFSGSEKGGSKGSAKDIRLVTENTPQATYVYNTGGQGSYVTLRIAHQ